MERKLRLGEWAILGTGWFTTKRIMFAGESSPGIYSIVLEWSKNHNSAAYNLYFHKNQNEFPVFNGLISIMDVSGQELSFRFKK